MRTANNAAEGLRFGLMHAYQTQKGAQPATSNNTHRSMQEAKSFEHVTTNNLPSSGSFLENGGKSVWNREQYKTSAGQRMSVLVNTNTQSSTST